MNVLWFLLGMYQIYVFRDTIVKTREHWRHIPTWANILSIVIVLFWFLLICFSGYQINK